MGIDFLAFCFPGIAHGFGLLPVRDGQIQTDKGRLILADLTVDNVVLVGSFVEVGCGSHLLPEAEFILLEVLVHVLYDGRRYVLAKEIEGFLPLPGDVIPGAVVAGLLVDQAGVFQLI